MQHQMNPIYVLAALPVLPCFSLALQPHEVGCHLHFTGEKRGTKSIEQFAEDHTPTKWQKQRLNLLLVTQIPMQVPAGEIKTSFALQELMPEPGRKGTDKNTVVNVVATML